MIITILRLVKSVVKKMTIFNLFVKKRQKLEKFIHANYTENRI